MSPLRVCPKCRALVDAAKCPYCGTGDLPAPGPRSPGGEALRASRLFFGILLLDIVLYLLMIGVDQDREKTLESWFEPPSMDSLFLFGMQSPDLVRECGHWWRLVTSVFLHLDLLHLFLNCVSTLVVAPVVAAAFGFHRTVVLYLLTGIAGAAASMFWGETGAGASGALCGLIGASAVYGWKLGGAGGKALFERMILWILLLGLWGLRGGVSNIAHGAGIASGALLAWIGAASPVRGGPRERVWASLGLACFALVGAVYGLILAPALARLPERTRLRHYQIEGAETLRRVHDSITAGAAVPSLPASLSGAPAGAERVAAALQRAVDATRLDPAHPDALLRYEEALDRWRDWSASLRRAWGIVPPYD